MAKVGVVKVAGGGQIDLGEHDSVAFTFENGSEILIYFDGPGQCLQVKAHGKTMPNLAVIPGGGENSVSLRTLDRSAL